MALKFKKETINNYKNYYKCVESTFSFLKDNSDHKELFLKSIKVLNTNNFRLVPVGNLHLNDSKIIEKMTKWRNKFSHTFLPSKKTNFNNTKKWLKNNVYKKKDKILFLVMKDGFNPIGHIGFANCFNKNLFFEIDNVLKGEKDKDKKIFSKVLKTIIEWANNTFYINNIILRVLKNNNYAIKFYEKNNFSVFNSKNNHYEKNYISMIYKSKKITNKLILTAGPSISQKEIVYVNDAVTNGWNNQASNYINKLERSFAKYLGCKYAISTSSCTGAMQIALMSLGIKKGDEVIVPNVTWVATAKAITYVGAKPVFADINLEDWTINPNSIEKFISKKTKAIMPVHLYGHPSQMDKIMNIAKKHKLHVVEDAAPAIGAEFKKKKCGTFGDFGAFSFQGAKLLVSGEGGMLVTNNYNLYKRALKISDHGRNEKKKFVIDSDGVKFKMSNIQAALALAQLERINELISLKRRIFGWYQQELKDLDNIRLNHESPKTKSIYWMTSIVLGKKIKMSRETFCKKLFLNKVDSRPVFPELSSFKIWGPIKKVKFKNSKFISERSINLPSGVCLNKDEVIFVCNKIKKILNKFNH